MLDTNSLSGFPGAKQIQNIAFEDLSYLVDVNIVKTIVSDLDFDLETGKPLKNNFVSNKIDTTFIDTIKNQLIENQNVCNDFIFKYPKVCEIDVLRDIQVTNETKISAIFVFEGASMKNMFGYYMYTIDSFGNKILLDNDDTQSDYHYKPTVIYPHVYSDDNRANTLKIYEKRELKGNLPNGNFENIFIGFFLVPHGWYAYVKNGPVANDSILYSTVDMNIDKKSKHNLVNDKIYSIFVKAISSVDPSVDMLMIGFEDLVKDDAVNDVDYNDCVVGFEISDVSNIVDYDKYSKIEFRPIIEKKYTNIVHIDDDGEYIYLPASKYAITNEKNYVLERHIRCSDKDKRDDLLAFFKDIKPNYIRKVEKRDLPDSVYELYIEHYFRKNDIRRAEQLNNKIDKTGLLYDKKIYLLESKFSENDHMKLNEPILNYSKAYASFKRCLGYEETYDFYEEYAKEKLISSYDKFDSPRKIVASRFRILGNGTMDCNNGDMYNIPHDSHRIFQVYKNINSNGKGLVINVAMDTHPNTFMMGKKNFVRYVTFIVDSIEHIVVDMGTLTLYKFDGLMLQTIQNLDTYSYLKITDMISVPDDDDNIQEIYKNDSAAYYRILTIQNAVKIYCVRTPNVKNSPCIVYCDTTNLFTWGNSKNILSGSYYTKKQRVVENHNSM